MTFFSRCEATQSFESAVHARAGRRGRTRTQDVGLRVMLAGFAEDIGILFRYAAGLDYYGRDRIGR
ncbi:MAG: hypothetical protein ACRYGP_18855 [Janthinobacterium lividum]